MFKSLLRTLPSLSGNFTIACKLNEIKKDDSENYHTYVRVADLLPLQNNIYKDSIELNLLNGKYEHDIKKYFSKYSNFFYKENYIYNKKNYKILNLNSLYNETNDNRNKDYEYGCKRIYYSRTGYQFSFYAPFYLDDINDLPEYFCIHIKIGGVLKNIKIYLNKDYKVNYLKKYLSSYFENVDNKVIFCLPESLQATYFGIDVKKGGLVQYKDNMFGYLYTNQTMINSFDNIICKGFERNNIIMRQIIPISFMFNINDIFNEYERNYFSGHKMQILGYYYSQNDIKYDMFDFDIDYFNPLSKFKKYNERTGKYEYSNGQDNSGLINVMNVGYPALNESKYTKYEFENKISPNYCKFKLMLSSDEDPYITNTNFGYSYLQYPNQKYGYFPTSLKGINPGLICINGDIKLPIGKNIDNFYNTSKYFANTIITNNVNFNKYLKLMNNYIGTWFNIYYNENIDELCNNSKLWSDVISDYTYFKGILFNLFKLNKYNIDKFGVFLNCNMNVTNENELCQSKYVYSYSDESSKISYKFNSNYNMKIYNPLLNLTYYNKFFINNILSTSSVNQSYLHYNRLMKKDLYGKYIKDDNYKNENIYFKLSDVNIIINKSKFPLILKNKILEYLNTNKILGYIILDGTNNLNYFEKYYDIYGSEYFRFMLTESLFNTNNKNQKYEWLYNKLYYSSQTSTKKVRLSTLYNKIEYDENIGGKFIIYLEDHFVSLYDIYFILIDIFNSVEDIQIIDESINDSVLSMYNKIKSINDVKILINKIQLYKDSNNIDALNELGFNDFNEALSFYQTKLEYELEGKTLEENFNYYKEQYKKIIFMSCISSFEEEKNKYVFENYGKINDIDIENYFVKLINIKSTKPIYVDSYNLNELISIFNKETKNNISIKSLNKKDYFIKLLNREHIFEYSHKLNRDENNISPFEFDENNNYVNKNILEYLYVKERKWIIDNNIIKTIDTYTTLYNYILKYIISYSENNKGQLDETSKANVSYVHNLINTDNDAIDEWFFENISNSRNLNNKFELKINTLKIEVDLCIRKKVYKLNEDLFNVLYYNNKVNNYLYLYIEDNCKNENNDIWGIFDSSYINTYNSSIKYYDWEPKYIDKQLYEKDINEYLVPLFTDVYINDNNKDVLFNMIQNKKINNYEYVINNETYFKEIDTLETLYDIYRSKEDVILSLFNSIIDINKPSTTSSLYIKIRYLLNNYYDDLVNTLFYNFNNFNTKLYGNGSVFVNRLKLYDKNTKSYEASLCSSIEEIVLNINKQESLTSYLEKNKILEIFNNDYKIKYIDEHPNYDINDPNIIVKAQLEFLKNEYSEYYYNLIKENNIILYSLNDDLIISLNKFNNDNLIYDDKYNMYIYDHNGLTYAFYFINININNSNHSFNILNDFNLNVIFNSINGHNINEKELINTLFPILYPFLKINIFEEFIKLIDTIVYQNELEILIKYTPGNYITYNEQKKYQNYITSSNDKLYNSLVEFDKHKKIKILRYFNYITPYLRKIGNTIENVWTLKFMESNDEYNNIEKFNILDVNDINIYKYEPLTVYNNEYKQWDETLNIYYQFTNSYKVNQIEYKHFNDNVVYNLPEKIILYDDQIYNALEIESIKNNKEYLYNAKIDILYKFFYKNVLDYSDIKLFLFNKYDSSFFIEKNNNKYRIKYIFNLI